MKVLNGASRAARCGWVAAAAIGTTIAGNWGTRQEWVGHNPSLSSQVTPIQASQARSLLGRFCERLDIGKFEITCMTGALSRAFADVTDHQFRPQGVMFGHFTGSESQDAVVSGWSAEGHPSHWGGTLLLTQRAGGWEPRWYRSGLITSACEKTSRPDGRNGLVCEFEDGGMGHRYHVVYGVDLRRPMDQISPLAEADSFSDFCSEQKQTMGPLVWEADHRSFSIEIRTSGWHIMDRNLCAPAQRRRPPSTKRLEFDVTADWPHMRSAQHPTPP
jgi:hypothetical protein